MGILQQNRAVLKSHTCEWATPKTLFDQFDLEFNFTLDVAATEQNRKCVRYFSSKENGLEQPWAPFRCWMNPPYGPDLKHWMKKAWEESKKGALVVCLVPSRTDTRWWHEYALNANEIRFIQGRIHFEGNGCNGQATFPSCVIVFRGEGNGLLHHRAVHRCDSRDLHHGAPSSRRST